MPHVEFLDLVRMVESLRKCEGREHMEVTDTAMARAREADTADMVHPVASSHETDLSLICPECRAVAEKRHALREVLRSQGVVFPTGLLEP